MKKLIYITVFALILWILGFIATYIITYLVPLEQVLDNYISYIGIILFFLVYSFIIHYLFKLLKLKYSFINHLLLGLIPLLINLSLDILFVFPLYPEIEVFSYALSYIGYSLMFLVPLILYSYKKYLQKIIA